MTCRHGRFDPNCSSYHAHIKSALEDYQRVLALGIQLPHAPQTLAVNPLIGMSPPSSPEDSPNARSFEIEDVHEINGNLALKVRYPNCARCSYEGVKVLVFHNTSIRDALLWTEIDPHFRADVPNSKKIAPSPSARFPASDQGWKAAQTYLETTP